MSFADRKEAGERLAELLTALEDEDLIVFALPRGGVAVGFEVARRLHAPLDLVFVRKIGHPGNPEAAIGAVTEDGEQILDPHFMSRLDTTWLDEETSRQANLARKLRDRYLGGRGAPDLQGKTAILVDDGIATGYTMKAAILWAKSRGAARIVVAAPVAPLEVVQSLRELADEVVIVETPEQLFAVGAHFTDFRQVADEEVRRLLESP